MRLSGLEPLTYQPNKNNMRETFLMIGERCNVAGSSIYKKAIVDGNYDKAASIATKQVQRATDLIKALSQTNLEGCSVAAKCRVDAIHGGDYSTPWAAPAVLQSLPAF